MKNHFLGLLIIVSIVTFGNFSLTVVREELTLSQMTDLFVLIPVTTQNEAMAASLVAVADTFDVAPDQSCVTLSRNLTIGSTGNDVTGLQQKLGINPATGYFGSLTQSAVKKFQANEGIPVTGIADPLTRATFNGSYGCDKPTETTVCTADAKLCPDGSYVGRDGNNRCEFKKCPTTTTSTGDTSNWNNPDTGLEINSYTFKDILLPNEAPYVSNIAANTKEGSTATPDEGFTVQGLIFKSGSKSADQALNGTFNYSQKTWDLNFKPIGKFGKYRMEIVLFCSQTSKSCGDKYNYDQVVKVVNLEVRSVYPVLTVTSPNGGEEYKPGDMIDLKWSSVGTERKQKIVIYLLDEVSRYGKVIFEGAPNTGKQGWKVSALTSADLQDKSGNYLKPSGRYVIHIGCVDASCTSDASDSYFKIKTDTVSEPSSITLLSPNGGERWMLNSGDKTIIRWEPDGSSRDVTAYLEKRKGRDFVTIGKVIEVSKGSIVWGGEIDTFGNYPKPGNGYYIRIVNNKTGATDRSDKPFTIVPADYVKVDLKINKSDDPVYVKEGGSEVTVRWTSRNAKSCTLYPGDLGERIDNLPARGERKVFLKENTFDYNYAISMLCNGDYGGRSDYVEVLPASSVPVARSEIMYFSSINTSGSAEVSWSLTKPAYVAIYQIGCQDNTPFTVIDTEAKKPISSCPGKGVLIEYPTKQKNNVFNLALQGVEKSRTIKMELVVLDDNHQPTNETESITALIPAQGSGAPSTQPSITVLSPNGGESYGGGEPMRIRWDSYGGDKIAIHLSYSDGKSCYIATVSSSNTDYTFTPGGYKCPNIPQTISSGQFKVALYLHKDGVDSDIGVARDYSDSLFAINLTTSMNATPPLSQSASVYFSIGGLINLFKALK